MLFLLFACAPRLYSTEKAPCEDEENVWFHTQEVDLELESQGFDVGERPPDFCQQDQNGDTVSLYQFYGSTLVLDVSAGWCKPCQALAGEIGASQRKHEDHGLVYLSVLPQDYQSGKPSVAFADAWEKDHMVRWEDEDGGLDSAYVGLPQDDIAPVIVDLDLWSFALTESTFPVLLLLDDELRVLDLLPTSHDALEKRLTLHFDSAD